MSEVSGQVQRAVKKLGRNQGGYRGETIEAPGVLRAIHQAARACGWREEALFDLGSVSLRTLHQPRPRARARVYISTGIHGDEPAGLVALLTLLRENRWPEAFEYWLCPCLNLSGFELNQRENAQGLDLNRDYRHLRSAEIRAHVRWLERLPPFDLTLLLHEDWEANGFYLYELNPDRQPSLAEEMIRAVSSVCPIEHSEKVDNWAALGGVIRPDVPPTERPQWPEAVYLITHKTRLSYTLEAPSDFPLPVRVQAHRAAVRTALEAFAARVPCGNPAPPEF